MHGVLAAFPVALALLRPLCDKAPPTWPLSLCLGLLLVSMGTREGRGKFTVRWRVPKARLASEAVNANKTVWLNCCYP